MADCAFSVSFLNFISCLSGIGACQSLLVSVVAIDLRRAQAKKSKHLDGELEK